MSDPIADEPWAVRVRAVVALLRRGLPQFIGFEVLFRLVGAALFTPLTAWLAARLIAWSGSGAISNYDLAGFFLSVNGLLYLTVVATIAFALLFFEFGGLVALAIGLERGHDVRLPQLFRFLGAALPRLWRLALRQFLGYAALALPCLAAAGGAYLAFLTRSDIYYYLSVKPPEFWLAAGIAGAAALVFAVLALRLFVDWIFAVPLLLFGGAGPGQALRESRRLVSGRRREILGMLGAWLAGVAVLAAAAAGSAALLRHLLLGLAGQRVGAVITVIAVAGVSQFVIAGLVGVVAMATLACAVARRFLRHRTEVGLPASLAEGGQVLARVGAWLRAAWVLVLLFGALATLAAYRLVERVRVEESFAITAHRGSSIAAPENTLAAIRLAVEEGADYVEIDVQETQDGKVVLVHDKDLKRVFNIPKGIWEVTYDEIKDLDSGGWFGPAFSDQRVATLEQAIEAVKGRAKLNIELKFNGREKNLAGEVARLINAHGIAGQCVLTSLDYRGIRDARRAAPGVRTGVIVTSAIGDITRLEGDLLSVSSKAVTRDLIDRAHRKGMEVHVWTVNDLALMNSMIGMGVDNIITDAPKVLGEVRAHRAGLTNAEKVLLRLAEMAGRRW